MQRFSTEAPEIQKIGHAPVRVLENSDLHVELVPGLGGKFISLRSRRTGTEWLLPPLRPHAEAKTTGGFEEWDGGGFDECLPTVSATASVPDHGELWRHPWQEDAANDAVLLRTTALGGAIAFARRARLDGASLLLDYALENRSDSIRRLLYCAHPLLRVEEGDRILLSPKVKGVQVANSADDRLGAPGAHIGWPRPEAGRDLGIVGPPDGMQADKLFAGPLREGWAALLRPSLDEGVEVTFDSHVLPYLGLWICRAAWPEGGAVKQYTVAFEPASASRDSLDDAERDGSAWRLQPGEQRRWQMRIRLAREKELEQHAGAHAGRPDDRD